MVIEGLLQRVGLHDLGVLLAAMLDGVDVLGQPVGVRPDQEPDLGLACHTVAELDHLPELPARVHVQQRERDGPGMKGFLGEAQHHRGILADRVQHPRVLELRCDFPDDVDALGFELLQM